MTALRTFVAPILNSLGFAYKGLNVLDNDELRQGIKTYSNRPSIPQRYVKSELVGGCDVIRETFQSGELQSMFKGQSVSTKSPATACRRVPSARARQMK